MEIIKKIEAIDFPNKETWINEALFGYQHVKKFLEGKQAPMRVLEVGCGSGILLSMVQQHYSDHTFEGLEPFGDGFNCLAPLNEFVKKNGIVIKNIGYETYEPTQKFDLIYLVNVFEHLKDWRGFIDRLEDWLSDQGVCLILCPNYSFPYEAHFRVPIILNKQITFRCFKKYIEKFERANDSVGLWNSLNFVKMRIIKKHVANSKLIFSYKSDILDEMIDRLNHDETFLQRQKFIGRIAKILRALGGLKIFKAKIFENFHPYMKLEIRKKTPPVAAV